MRLLALLALPLAGMTAALSAPPSVGLAAAAPGDTAKVVATWPVASDARGPADSYNVKWTWGTGPTVFSLTTTRLTDTLTVILPAYPDSIQVRVTVKAKRRGLTSTDSATAVRWFKRDEAPPPAPAAVALDTAATL